MPRSTCLAAMPWQAIESPSLPLGLLRACCAAEGLPVPRAYHGGLRLTEFLMAATDGGLGAADYTDVAENGLFHGLGDWVFTGVLHDDPDFGVTALDDYLTKHAVDVDRARRIRPYAAEFIELAVAEILDGAPDTVGFSTTFMQNVPSLAAARRIKQLAPEVAIVFGGGNCDGDMGTALHRNYRFVDYVVRGEGEIAFPALLRALEGEVPFADVPGLCWWDGDTQRVNDTRRHPVPPARIPVPDFDDWFAHLDASPVRSHVEPKLVVETARGCWWGEAHHCTFCGLNGTLMEFRSKSPDRVLDELAHLVSRHQVLDVITVDNIIDNNYFRTVLPRIAEQGWDLRVHYELKSNLKPAEVEVLRRAGVAHVQPGIESLVSPVLKLMDKGVSGLRNVRTLRDCESHGLTVSWNWLYGFPGETAAEYADVVRQLPALCHLQPPSAAGRILLERFSPYFDNPALGFPERSSADLYAHVYRLPEAEKADLVYLFDTPDQGLSEAEAAELVAQVHAWHDLYSDSYLQRLDEDGAIVLQDRRVGWPREDVLIEDPDLVAAYGELEQGRTFAALVRRLAEAGRRPDPDALREWVDALLRRGLLFSEAGGYLALATTAVPVKVG
ncbi:RiPP maturation radical SAM C-methyltransferase [Actinosynnema sp. NPDC059797]